MHLVYASRVHLVYASRVHLARALVGSRYLDAGELEQLLRQTRLYEHFTVKVRNSY